MDETKLYISFSSDDDKEDVLCHIKACIAEIQKWMSANFLKLNQDKTELMIISQRYDGP